MQRPRKLERIGGHVPFNQVGSIKSLFNEFTDKNGAVNSPAALQQLLHRLDIPSITAVDVDELFLAMQMKNQNGGNDDNNNSSSTIDWRTVVMWFPTFQLLQTRSSDEDQVDGKEVCGKVGGMPMGIDWAALPVEHTAAQKKLRMDLYAQFDPNGNGFLSLAEVDKGFRDVLHLKEVFDCKPVLMRAFQAARNLNDGKISKKNIPKEKARGMDYIEKCEFRMLLWYVRQYFELYTIFQSTSNGLRIVKLDRKEFERLRVPLVKWGLDKKMMEDRSEDEIFAEVDVNSGGSILFDEFSKWALQQKFVGTFGGG